MAYTLATRAIVALTEALAAKLTEDGDAASATQLKLDVLESLDGSDNVSAQTEALYAATIEDLAPPPPPNPETIP